MLDGEQFINNKHHLHDSPSLHTIQRKISKQKIAAEHRTEQSNGDQMFESSRPNLKNLYYSQQNSPLPPSYSSDIDTILRHSTNSRMLHGDNDTIITGSYDQQAFHQPNTRKVTKITPKENYSISNARPIQQRSASASVISSAARREAKESSLTPNDVQRLKHVRRHEPAHHQSGVKSGLITPDSWKTDPVVFKKPSSKKSIAENVTKPPKSEKIPKSITEQLTTETKPRTEKKFRSKRDTSAPKPSTSETVPAKPTPRSERSKEEKEKLKKYILEKREQHEKQLMNERKVKFLQDYERKDKLKKLNEQIKTVAQQPLPPSLIKKSSTTVQSNDITETKRERLLNLLGPRPNIEPPADYHSNTPFERPSSHERSSSSSSSSSSASSSSVIEIQPAKLNDSTAIRSRIEQQPIHSSISNGLPNDIKLRHLNILRWANNLARDCDVVETKFKYFRPDGTQTFDIIPPSVQQLKHDDGNLRLQPPVLITNNNNNKKVDPEPIISSKIIRPSGRLSHLNQNHISEYQGQKLPGVGNLRDPLLEKRIRRDYAATKIQAVYRGYTVRKSLNWSNENQQQLNSKFNKRPTQKPKKTSSYATDIYDNLGTSLDIRFNDDNFTIGSTLLRHYQRQGTHTIPLKHHTQSDRSEHDSKKLEKPKVSQTYSDDYENTVSSASSVSIHQQRTPQKPRVIQQPIPTVKKTLLSSTSSDASSSSPSPISLTPTQEPYVPSNVQRRRSLSPPIPPPMSPDNGRAIRHQTQPPPITTTSSKRTSEERRYSPDALERQLNAELHLLDGVEASMKQIDNMERLRSVALAQQEIVSLAQVLKHRPTTDGLPHPQTTKPSARQISSSSANGSTTSSSSSRRKRRSPSPKQIPSKHKSSHRRNHLSPSSSSSSSSTPSESILTEREKNARQKYHNEVELKEYEKRLTDIEKKIRKLVKRAPAVLEEKKNVPSGVRVPSRSSNDSSISEDIPASHKSSSSTSSTVRRKSNNDTSEIRTETNEKESDSSSASIRQPHSETITTDASDIERRIRVSSEQLNKKKTELEKLKEQNKKEALRKQEDDLKRELQAYEQELEKLRLQQTTTTTTTKAHLEPKKPVASRLSPAKPHLSSSSSSSSSTISTPAKPQESSIAEDLPATITASESKTDIVQKPIQPVRPTITKQRDFFDDDDDEEEVEAVKKPELKPLDLSHDERDTQHDALSVSIATDLVVSSETDNDHSRRQSTDNEKPILNLNKKIPSPSKSKTDSESSSSTPVTGSSEKSSKQQRPIERKASPIANDYDEDFSDVSHSHVNTSKGSISKPKIDNIDIESIQEDIDDKHSSHDTNQSSTSKSSGDEQSEILVLVKKSANNTPRRQDEKTPNDDFFVPSPPLIPPVTVPQIRSESNNNDDTSHDISDDDEVNERLEQENKVDKLADSILRTFIDEAIGQSRQIERLKKDQLENSVTKEAQEWMSDDESSDDEAPNPPPVELGAFDLDLSELDVKRSDEPRVESPRKIVIEEQVKLFVPHTNEQVTQLCHDAVTILMDQNKDFSNRSAINCHIPSSYFAFDQQDSDNNTDIQQNHHAYCQMIFDLCAELLHEMYSENIQPVQYPDWQTTKLIPKRFYRGIKPHNRHEIEQFIQAKILELLNLNPRQITYTKWRVSKGAGNGKEKFETVLDEEIRRTESQWINYNDDCTQLKFDVADSIFDQLIQDTITSCLDVVDRRFFFSGDSTRL